jgi:WD domain, G-beta repeat
VRPASLWGRYWDLLADPVLRGPLPREGLSLRQRYWLLLTAAGPVSPGGAAGFPGSASADGSAVSRPGPAGQPGPVTSAQEAGAERDILAWPDRRGLVQRLVPLVAVAAVVMLVGIAVGTKSASVPRIALAAPQPSPYAILPDPGSAGVADVAFNGSGTMFATADLNGRVFLWNAATDKLAATLLPSSLGVAAVAFSPDGNLLAAGNGNGTASVWELPGYRHLATFRCGGNALVSAVAFSTDSKFLLAGTAASKGPACLWNMSNQAEVGTLTGNNGGVTAVAFSPGGTTVAVADAAGVINLWDYVSLQLVATLTTPGARVNSVAISPDGKLLAAGGPGGTTRLWDLATRTSVTLTAHTGSGSITSVAFSPSGTVLAAATQNGSAYLWNTGTHHLIAEFADPASGGINAIAFNPELAAFATADQNGLIYLWSYTPVPPARPGTAPQDQRGQPGQELGAGILTLQGNGTGYDLDAVNTGWARSPSTHGPARTSSTHPEETTANRSSSSAGHRTPTW